jgi:oligosaccharide repeat unit polymerase
VSGASDATVVLLLGFAGAALLLVFITRKAEDFLHAATLFSLVWGLNLVACELLPYQNLRLDTRTLVVAVAAWWMFLLGFLAASSFRWPVMCGSAAVNPTRAKILLLALIGLQMVAIVLEMRQSGLLQGQLSLWGQIASLAGKRTSGAMAEIQIPSVWGLWRWDFTLYLPLAFVMYRCGSLRLRGLVGLIMLAGGSAVLRFTRAPLLDVITIAIVGVAIARPAGERAWRVARRRLAVVVLGFGVFAGLFIAMERVLASTVRDNSLGEGQTLIAYVGGPLRAYQDLLQQGDWTRSDRLYSLDAIDFLAYKLGLRVTYEGHVRPYTDVGAPTNIYTYLDAFTLDAGVFGALGGSLFLGAGVGWLFYLVRRKGSYWSVVMYSYSAYNCLMVGVNNQFIQFFFFLWAGIAFLLGFFISAKADLPVSAGTALPAAGD